MSERRHPNIVNIDEVEPVEREHGRFRFKARRLGDKTSARGVSCSHYEVEPGKTAFPAHYHCAAEEAIYVLEGSGALRIGEQTVALRAGDFVTFPVGPDHAHQLVADGDGPLRYLCMATMPSAEVVGYPDSDKIAALAGPVGGDWADSWVLKWFRAAESVDYFDGESDGGD